MIQNRYGRINLGYMEDITGIGKDELIAVLKGQMYYQPDGHYQIAAKVLSGNIYEKIDEIESAIRERSSHSDETDQKFDVVGKLEETKAALVSVIPTQIAFDDIGQWDGAIIQADFHRHDFNAVGRAADAFAVPGGADNAGAGCSGR